MSVAVKILKAVRSSLASELRTTLRASHRLRRDNPLHRALSSLYREFLSRLWSYGGFGNDEWYPACLAHAPPLSVRVRRERSPMPSYGRLRLEVGYVWRQSHNSKCNVSGKVTFEYGRLGKLEKMRLRIVTEIPNIPGMSVCRLPI